MGKRISPEEWLRNVQGSRVLLVNPHVVEMRYPWVRWNQPVDLLKLSTLLKAYGCSVEILDCMLPHKSGRVRVGGLGSAGDAVDKSRRSFGVVLDRSLDKQLSLFNAEWPPDHIVVTSLTSYWSGVIPRIRAALHASFPAAKIALTGAFPVFEPDRALRCSTDFVIDQFFPTADVLPNYGLYTSERTKFFHQERRPLFAGLTFHPKGDVNYVLQQIELARAADIQTFVFFEDNLFEGGGEQLTDILRSTASLGRLDFRGLCGIVPSDAPEQIWNLMLEAGYRSVHLEYDTLDNRDLNYDAYDRALRQLSSWKLSSGDLSGFVVVGAPGAQLERLVKHTLDILAATGSVIPKPYTPDPGSDVYRLVLARSRGNLERLSPRDFPLDGTGLTDLSREDFEHFFGLTTELNKKYRGRAFDFFDESAVTAAFRSSLSKGVWRLVE